MSVYLGLSANENVINHSPDSNYVIRSLSISLHSGLAQPIGHKLVLSILGRFDIPWEGSLTLSILTSYAGSPFRHFRHVPRAPGLERPRTCWVCF